MRLVVHSLSALTAGALAACAPSTPAAPAPAPAPTTPAAPAPPLREAPLNWHLLDPAEGVPGISVLRAERELLRGRQPARTVLVAIIDNGVDTSHAALRSRLWSNPREVAGNGRDDDNNGYVDDVRGWNLIGGKDGKNVNQDTYELTRLAAACGDSVRARKIPAEYRQRCPQIQQEFTQKRVQIEGILGQINQIEAVMQQIVPRLKAAARTDTLTRARVEAIVPTNDTIRQARQVYLNLANAGIDEEEIRDAKKAYTSQVQYGYNLTFDPRPIVGDDYPDTLVNRYGNRDVAGADPEHGTHVAGIVAALRDNGGTGIASSVRIMALRTVPDGDERDKDVAYAIRYAVDQGAQIINMSFGKSYSPFKEQVDAAVKYADSKGVLMVHGAGNDGKDLSSNASFPTPVYKEGGRARHWIEVGATSWKSNDSLVANFSNYGKAQVDVFAPGVDIYSTLPGGGYKKNSGTSMASPVVAGLAALLMSYYPTLGAAEVKRIILESSTKLVDRMVVRPGEGGGQVRFGELSSTGGIVNAYEAIRMADRMTGTRP
jgi:subtilisin family serine protease